MPDVCIWSYGFKYGTHAAPNEFDVTDWVKNPARVAPWNLNSRVDDEMREFVLEQPKAQAFLDLVEMFALTSLSNGPGFAHIGIKCNAGRHRSPIIAEELAARLVEHGYKVKIKHYSEDD